MNSLYARLETQWRAGRLRTLEGDLDRFLRVHLDDIRAGLAQGHLRTLAVARRRRAQGTLSDRDLLDLSVRALLAHRRSCNPAGDILEQLAEIRRGGKAWSTHHARAWREWRVYQLLYIWQKKRDHYLGLLARAA